MKKVYGLVFVFIGCASLTCMERKIFEQDELGLLGLSISKENAVSMIDLNFLDEALPGFCRDLKNESCDKEEGVVSKIVLVFNSSNIKNVCLFTVFEENSAVSGGDILPLERCDAKQKRGAFDEGKLLPRETFESLTKEALSHFVLIRKMVDLLSGFLDVKRRCYTYFPPNPYYNQTEQGCFLECKAGIPATLWTPWGKVILVDQSLFCSETIRKKFFERIKIELYKENKFSPSYGDFGPIYKILAVDDQILPEPVERSRDTYIDYDVVRSVWKKLEEYSPYIY